MGKMEKIDFVITWVDGSDPAWLNEKSKYEKDIIKKNIDNREVRYREWKNLKYWFRAVEKYAPWVNKIYFITWGHLPEWLNLKNEKLVIVKHEDYIPKEYLPTFNSITIELNMHRIPNLSEKFVYFNDDMFITNYTKPEDFFYQNLPCDYAILSAIVSDGEDGFEHTLLNNMNIINKYFNKSEVLRKNFFKWFNFKYGKEQLRTMLLLPWNNFPGIKYSHLPVSYNKSTFNLLWEKEEKKLNDVCKEKFRNNYIKVNHWVMQDWQLVSGNFFPRSVKFGKFFILQDDNYNNILQAIKKKKFKTICINDDERILNFDELRTKINDAFEETLNKKSSFEK